MPKISVSVTRTTRKFAGNRYTTFARFKLKPQEDGPTFVYEGNATGSDFIAKCERLKRKATIIDVAEFPSVSHDDWKQSVVRRALDQTSI